MKYEDGNEDEDEDEDEGEDEGEDEDEELEDIAGEAHNLLTDMGQR